MGNVMRDSSSISDAQTLVAARHIPDEFAVVEYPARYRSA
jgi:hypothetical protein